MVAYNTKENEELKSASKSPSGKIFKLADKKE